MQKRFNNLFAVLIVLTAIVLVLVGTWYLSRPINRAKAEQCIPVVVAQPHLEMPDPAPEPQPAPDAEPDKPTYDPAIPLSPELQQALFEACEEAGVPVPLALGLIEVESSFQVDAVNSEGCYGLCQLNPLYFPAGLSPADNLREGIGYLGQLLERYGDVGAALTAYCVGYDAGGRVYAGAVLEAAERWSAERILGTDFRISSAG